MANRKRVLVVIDSMEVGGSQRQVQKLIEGLDKDEWEPELAYFTVDSFLAEAIRQSGVRVHYVPKRRKFDFRFVMAYAKLLRDRRFALVHAFSLTAEFWTMVARIGLAARPVLIASERSSGRVDRPFWYWWAKRLVLASSAAVIANSHAGAHSSAQRMGLPVQRFTTISNAVDVPPPLTDGAYQTLRESLGSGDECLVGLFVGRLVAVKNLPCLVRALAKLEPDRRPLMLLAGDGPLRQPILGLAKELGVDPSLRCLGERKDVAQLMQFADFLVLPSRFEGQSNALLEAMAAGCPVVASAVGGNVELVRQGKTGLLFEDDDADALAACIDALRDEAVRSRLSKTAKEEVIQNFCQSKLSLETSVVYQRSLGTQRSTGRILTPSSQTTRLE